MAGLVGAQARVPMHKCVRIEMCEFSCKVEVQQQLGQASSCEGHHKLQVCCARARACTQFFLLCAAQVILPSFAYATHQLHQTTHACRLTAAAGPAQLRQ